MKKLDTYLHRYEAASIQLQDAKSKILFSGNKDNIKRRFLSWYVLKPPRRLKNNIVKFVIVEDIDHGIS